MKKIIICTVLASFVFGSVPTHSDGLKSLARFIGNNPGWMATAFLSTCMFANAMNDIANRERKIGKKPFKDTVNCRSNGGYGLIDPNDDNCSKKRESLTEKKIKTYCSAILLTTVSCALACAISWCATTYACKA